MLFAALARPAAQLYLEFFDDPAVVTPLARSVVGPAVKKKFCAANEKHCYLHLLALQLVCLL